MTRADFPLEFATPEELSAYIQELQKFQAQMNHPMDRVCLRCGTVYLPTQDSYRAKGKTVMILRPKQQCYCGPEWDE